MESDILLSSNPAPETQETLEPEMQWDLWLSTPRSVPHFKNIYSSQDTTVFSGVIFPRANKLELIRATEAVIQLFSLTV